MKRTLAFLLALLMVVSVLAGCNPDKDPDDTKEETEGTKAPGTDGDDVVKIEEFDPNKKYTYNAAVSAMPTGWNPHTYQSADDAVYFDYTTDSLYTLFFNDEIHPQEGREAFDGYVIVPSMAADFPVDVTEDVKKSHPQFDIPESAKTGYAWQVTLRDGLKWQDGTPITAQDFVDSLERVLRSELLNFRASDYSHGTYAVVNAEPYSLAGTTSYTDNSSAAHQLSEMTKNDAGQYVYTGKVTGESLVYIALGKELSWLGGETLTTYVEAYGDNYFGLEHWEELKALANEEGLVPCTDDNLALLSSVTTTNPAWGESDEDLFNYLIIIEKYPDEYAFSNVGLFADGNKLTFVYANALEGFYLMTYGMSTQYLVKTDLYDQCLTSTDSAAGKVWSSTYGTDIKNSVSYGPYVMTDYQSGKSMHFSKNENWWGWTSDVYTYVDPESGKGYRMYQTTDVDLQYVKESATRKEMFLNGKLMSYGLQAEDYDQYRTSENYYSTPAETIYFLLFNGYEEVINDREAAEDFDKSKSDLQTQMLESFRRACAVSIDRENFAATVSPARSGGYAFVGDTYIYDPETCAFYRDTDQAKRALVNFYSINLDDFNGDLDKAVESITGYDPETAKAKFAEAYKESLEKGYITDSDNDGKSDQTVTMVYAGSGEANDFIKKTIGYLNDSLNGCAKGTGFEGKIEIVYANAGEGDQWAKNVMSGVMDTQLAGWSGSTLDPFGMADTWTNPAAAYWGAWYDANDYKMELTIDGEKIEMSLRDWALCLNGTMKTVNGKDYNFGYGQTSVDNRLTILAAIEEHMLTSYNCVPILQNGSGSLLSKQVYYVVEEYNPMMGRGGIQYMKYNFDDAEWTDYVAEQGGTLQY